MNIVSFISSFKKPSRPSKVRATVCEWAIAALQFPGKVVAQNTTELPSEMGYILSANKAFFFSAAGVEERKASNLGCLLKLATEQPAKPPT